MFNKKAEIEWLPVNALVFDPDVQRALIPARVKYLARAFDPGGVGIVTVSQREDGRRYVIDGQHRITAAREAGHGEMKVKCHIYHHLTRPQEAQQFLVLNDARTVSSIDKFKVGLVAEDPVCLTIDAMLRRYGLRADGGGSNGTISCIETLIALYGRSPEVLEQVLAISTTAWGTRHVAVERLVIAGLGIVAARYNGELDQGALVNRLNKYKGGPGGLIGDSRQLADIKPISKTRAFAEIVVDAYNKGRSTGALAPL